MLGRLSENDLKIKFCILNKTIGEKRMNQYRFDDKFKTRVLDFFENTKEEETNNNSLETKDDSKLFVLPKVDCEKSNFDDKNQTSTEADLHKIFDYKKLFDC